MKEVKLSRFFEDNKNLNLFKYLVNKYKSAPFPSSYKKEDIFKSIEKIVEQVVQRKYRVSEREKEL